jgi:hypothetical protein
MQKIIVPGRIPFILALARERTPGIRDYSPTVAYGRSKRLRFLLAFPRNSPFEGAGVPAKRDSVLLRLTRRQT